MAATKVVRPMLGLAHMPQFWEISCKFSSTSRLMKKARSPGMAPKVKKAIRARVSSPISKNHQSKDHDEYLNPGLKATFVGLLQSAFKSQLIPIDGETQIEFLRQYRELQEKNSSFTERAALCKDYDLMPIHLYHLSKILGNVVNERPVARAIMFDATELGETLAACELVEAAIRRGAFSHPDFALNLQRLEGHVDSTTPSGQQAMVTLGNYLLSQKKYSLAMKMYTDATGSGTDSDASIQAYFNMGKIYLIWKKRDAAYSAFMKSATGGHLKALYYVATATEDGSDNQKAAYQLAAASGVHEACHNLGDAELKRIEGRLEKPKAIFEYGMAREWFEVAAADAFVPSMLNMALICKAVNDKDRGMEWLENAEKWLQAKPSPEMQSFAKRIRSNWSDGNINVTGIDSGYCGKIDPFKEIRETEA